ncbi:putative protein-like [Forsythia ovata]|uniref:Uncharacterized protein n=1 Tax=Forsythia ovata TaxID=205694 RepID=A0ABD1VDV4_9LAMI
MPGTIPINHMPFFSCIIFHYINIHPDNLIILLNLKQQANAENTRAKDKLSSKKIDHNLVNCKAKEQPQLIAEESKGLQGVTGNFALNKVPSGPENLKPQKLTRSRSFRLSQDLDDKPETLLNPTPS